MTPEVHLTTETLVSYTLKKNASQSPQNYNMYNKNITKTFDSLYTVRQSATSNIQHAIQNKAKHQSGSDASNPHACTYFSHENATVCGAVSII